MLSHPTLEKFEQLRFKGMLRALRAQQDVQNMDQMNFMDRLGLLVDHRQNCPAPCIKTHTITFIRKNLNHMNLSARHRSPK